MPKLRSPFKSVLLSARLSRSLDGPAAIGGVVNSEAHPANGAQIFFGTARDGQTLKQGKAFRRTISTAQVIAPRIYTDGQKPVPSLSLSARPLGPLSLLYFATRYFPAALAKSLYL